jgi:hypothetical protein
MKMGREIRKVPPNWQPPKIERPNHRRGQMEERDQPMFDRAFAPAMREWIAEWEKWERGERPDYCDDEASRSLPYWKWEGGPPDPEYYRPDWKPEEMTWFQLYETVSEGTPVTPAFATREELVEYLVANGDYWDQKRRAEGCSIMRCTPWPRAEAESFVFGAGWAPSMIVSDGRVMTGTEGMAALRHNTCSPTDLPG